RWRDPSESLKEKVTALFAEPTGAESAPAGAAALYLDFTHANRSFLERAFPGSIAARTPGNPRLRVLFAMREEYIARLDPHLELLPNRLRARFGMERLGRPAALSAITEPLKLWGCTFQQAEDGSAADDLVGKLLQMRFRSEDPTVVQQITGEYV